MGIELGYGLRSRIEKRVANEKEGEKTANGVDRAQAGSTLGRESSQTLCLGLLSFPTQHNFGIPQTPYYAPRTDDLYDLFLLHDLDLSRQVYTCSCMI